MAPVNLRKASVIQRNIQARIKELQSSLEINTRTMDIWNTNPNKFVVDSSDAAHNNIAQVVKLRRILGDIRHSVGAANHNCGVNAYLTSRELIKHNVSMFNSLRKADIQLSPEELESKIQYIKKSDTTDTSSYGRGAYGRNSSASSVEVNIFNKEDIENMENMYNSSKADLVVIEDELLRINMNSNITISEVDYSFLKELHLV